MGSGRINRSFDTPCVLSGFLSGTLFLLDCVFLDLEGVEHSTTSKPMFGPDFEVGSSFLFPQLEANTFIPIGNAPLR